MQLLLNEFFQLLLCNLQERCPNSTDLQRLTESVFVVELKTQNSKLFCKEQIVLENSDIKWMNVTLINLILNEYLTLLIYWLFFVKHYCITNCFGIALHNVSMQPIQWQTCYHKIHLETKFAGNQSDLREREENNFLLPFACSSRTGKYW